MSSHTVNRVHTEELNESDRSNHCIDCGDRLRIEPGETYCPSCGTIVDSYRIDHGPEWTPWTERVCRRTGAPLTETLHDRGLATDIGWMVDGHGNPLSASTRRQFHRLRREHGRARFESKAQRNLGYGFDEIRRIRGSLGLPDTVGERACGIFRAAQTAGLLPGRSIESMAAASVFATCRCYGLPRRVEEVADHARVSADRISGDYRVLKQELGLRPLPIRPRDLVPRFASEMEVSDAVQGQAHELAVCAENAGLANGKKPSGVAAACVYYAATAVESSVPGGSTLTQAAIAEVAGVTPVTIRTCWRDLKETCE